MNDRIYLLPSSFIFEDSNLVDHIHQSYIDLQAHVNDDEKDEIIIKKDISAFLQESIKLLENNLPINLLTELISTISLCFSSYLEHSLSFYDKFFEKSRFNSNFIIVTSSIFSQITNSRVEFLDNQINFVNDTLKEILPQIQSSLQSWTIFNHPILPQFQDELLINLFLSSEMTKDLFFNFFRFILSRNIYSTSQKYNFLLQILSNADFLEIVPLTKAANEEINEFLSQQNFELISKMSFESFILVSMAVISIETQGELVFDGITENSVLQYIAVAAVIQKKMTKEIEIESTEILELICSKIDSLKSDAPPVFKESIKIIIDDQIDPAKYKLKFPFKNSIRVMMTIIKKIYDDYEFLPEKGQIFKYIFFLTTVSNNPVVQHFLQKIDVFHFVMNHLKEINLNPIFNYSKFYLNSIKPKAIIEYLNGLQNPEDVILCISFITNSCANVPKMDPTKELNKKLISVFNEKVQQENLKDAFLIGRFLQNYFYYDSFDEKLPQSFKCLLFNDFLTDDLSIDDIIELILTSPEAEEHDEYFFFLIKKMLNDKDILKLYLDHLVTVDSNENYNVGFFLAQNLTQFTMYESEVLDAVNRHFYFNGQALLKRNDFSLSSLPIPEFGLQIISKLLESIQKKQDNYQAFLCLKNIVCTFPFLFGKDPQRIFDSVINSLNHISLVFEDKSIENQTELVKTSLSALSFLFSFFQAPFVLDKLLSFLFKNILTFTNEQVACFMILLRSFYNDGLFNCVILAYFLKHDFMNSVGKLLERDISSESFKIFYRSVIYAFLNLSFSELANLRHYEIVQIKEFEKMEYPFNYMYDYIYLTSPRLVKLIESKENNVLFNFANFHFKDFIEKIDHLQSFWLLRSEFSFVNKEPDQIQIRDFIQELRKTQIDEIDVDSIPFSFPKLTIKMVRHLVLDRGFIYCWYLYSVKYPVVRPLCELLTKMADDLQKMENEAKENPDEEDNQNVLTVDIDSYMMKCYMQNNLHMNLVKQLFESKNEYLYDAIEAICLKKMGFKLLLESLSQFLSDLFGKDSVSDLNGMYRIIDFLIDLSKNEDFIELFIQSKCFDSLINVVLSPQMRNDMQILTKTANLFLELDKNILTRATHLIGFLLISEYEELIQPAIKLCSKFDQNQLNHLHNVLMIQFNEEIVKEKITDNLFYFLKYYKKSAEGHKSELIELLNKQFENFDDKNALENIGVILSALAPERNQIKDTQNMSFDQSIIPPFIRETSPDFWDLFEQYYSLLMDKIEENPFLLIDFRFLLDFPELVSFKIRSSLARKKMNMLIDYENYIDLMIDRKNILEASFEEIKYFSNDDLLNAIRVSFIDEPVEDYGGARREWFELLIKEIFNIKTGLFECSKKSSSYQPSYRSSLKPHHLEYFKFSGKMIARILIEGQCIDSHLTQSFYKQILHHEPNFQDLEDYDSELYQGLEWMLHNDVSSLDKVFAIEVVNENDKIETIQLKENGENIEVNNDNKNEYVDLYSKFVLKKRIEEQLKAFIDGFNSLIHPDEIKYFNQNELDLLLCGDPKFDVDDFKANTVFEHPYSAESPVIVLFFEVISKWNKEELSKLLMFMTGSSRVPANGFKEFCEITHYPLKICSGGDRSLLPQSHTCFNILHLPQYETEDEMNDKLHQAIKYCDSFGLM